MVSVRRVRSAADRFVRIAEFLQRELHAGERVCQLAIRFCGTAANCIAASDLHSTAFSNVHSGLRWRAAGKLGVLDQTGYGASISVVVLLEGTKLPGPDCVGGFVHR